MLEVHYQDMQDIEFTIERGKLYMLQCRVGKRSPQAAFKIAVDQATKGLMSPADAKRLVKKRYLFKKYLAGAVKPIITRQQAIERIQPVDIERLFYPVLDPKLTPTDLAARRLGEGIGAVPGAACGEVVFNAKEAEARAQRGVNVILVRKETSPEDVGGMHAAVGILTATGGKTSHAAVVARGWGKCCIVGCEQLHIDYAARRMMLNGRALHEGEAISLDGNSGTIYNGRINLVRPEAPPEFQTLMSWCDEWRVLGVRANADTPADAVKAVELGAEGIGLCRTEHMFFAEDRIMAVRQMIVAESEAERRDALQQILAMQKGDFKAIFQIMDGLPVTVRLLDPPLHEFLPERDLDIGVLAGYMRRPVDEIRDRVKTMHESNPMLGHRGCRLGITSPEIYNMQVQAILEAACELLQEAGITVQLEIMVPLIADVKELEIVKHHIHDVAERVMRGHGVRLPYLVGTMIELPRAVLTAGAIAREADFFSYGTNDLTQTTLGLSRDDAGMFLPHYIERGIFAHDPFVVLDQEGVGELIHIGVERGRRTRPDLKIGICGEHGGEPRSIAFCHRIDLDYVSCSPFRVPIARLAAAQAALQEPAEPGGQGEKANGSL